jgi:hypothetical protein
MCRTVSYSEKTANAFGTEEALGLLLPAVKRAHGPIVIHAQESRLNVMIRVNDKQAPLVYSLDYAGKLIQPPES